ncbi:TlpA family protein disulfide reductase [Maribacter sp. 2304DJ31-5]|uniref:TlpA family protein disulfide reductase n=1 Tax=Maribacter sp. 2304DJ31-5 TaxID=3386273 RepID=UPI0039BCB155
MKFCQIILVFLLIGLIGCQKDKNIIITGKIIGEIPEKVEYTTPINGTWFYGSKKSVQPDSSGNFRIIINIDSPSFITLYIPKKSNGTLLVESGKTYTINFNLDSTDKKFVVLGENHKGQNIYNSFPNPDFNIYGGNEFLKDSVASVISSKIKTAKEKEILLFTKLFDKGEISEDFFSLVKLDRECYYSSMQGRVASYKFMESERNKNEELKGNSLELWNEVVNNMPLTTPKLFRSPWFYSLADNFIEYNELKNESFDVEKLVSIYRQGLVHSHKIEGSKRYLNENKLEYYDASYIYYHCWQNKDNSKELITLYEKFIEEYPNSEYSNYLTSMVTPIIEFHKKVAKEISLNKKFRFIDNHNNIDSFSELLKPLRGKKIYIDIWTTWCGPCKREFKHKTALGKLLKSKNIELLYISHDKDEKNELWKEMIKGYGLEGYHIRANELLKTDMIKIFGHRGSFGYPRYILIGENGKIIQENAKKPSQLYELEKELNEISQT